MQRKPGFPVANCNIKMPDSSVVTEVSDDDLEPQHRRQQLINFGHAQWGFNNWNWTLTKQDLDFVELVNGKYTAGVAAFVNVTVKNFDIHRENVGYATSVGVTKGSAIHRARKCAVTHALRETLLSFGGAVSTELLELLESNKQEANIPEQSDNQAPKLAEPKNTVRKEEVINGTVANVASVANVPVRPPPAIKNAVIPPPIAKAHPMPANLPPAANRPIAPRPPPPPAPHVRPNNEANDEEARAERKRRQKQAQEEFRLKQLLKQKDMDKQELDEHSSFDNILMAIPSQDIVIEETGHTEGKRKSPAPEGSAKRRASVINKLDIVEK